MLETEVERVGVLSWAARAYEVTELTSDKLIRTPVFFSISLTKKRADNSIKQYLAAANV